MENEPQKSKSDNWLARLQEQSWEPEIIISGIVLFALYQMPDFIRQLEHFLINYSFYVFSSGAIDDLLISLLLVANIWLVIGFTAHLFLRSVWVAYIGLSFVYKKGIQTDRLRFRKSYSQLLFRDRGFSKTIHRLEEICSTTFAISFLLFMCILGAFFALTLVALFIAFSIWLFPDSVSFNWVDPVLTAIALLYIIDFISLGWLKRIPYFSTIYYPLYRIMGWATLSPFYRRIYYSLISNHAKWKAALLIFLFTVGSIFLTVSFRSKSNIVDALLLRLDTKDEKSMYSGHYQNLMEDDPSNLVQIPSDIISDQTLRVFLVHRTAFESRQIKTLCEYENRIDTTPKPHLVMDCLEAFYDLHLDDREVKTDYHYIKHPKTYQEGLVTYLDIAHLDKGMHNLSVSYNFWDDSTSVSQKVATVEFYKSKEAKHPEKDTTDQPNTIE